MLIDLNRICLVELFDGPLKPVLAQLAFQGINLSLCFFVSLRPPCVLSRLDSQIAVILNLPNILSTLFNELEEIRMPADLKLLHVC